MRGRRKITTRVIVFLLLAAILATTATILVAAWRREHTFDESRWKRVVYPHDQYRARVVDELLLNHDLRGKTRSQVVEFLGSPDTWAQKTTSVRMVYWLGPQRKGFPIDDDWLVITFDELDTVVSAATETD